jgi:hypothetical protein
VVLGHRAHGRPHVGAREEEIEADHGEDGDAERDQAREGEEHAADLEHREVQPDRPVIGRPEEGRERLQEEEEPAA